MAKGQGKGFKTLSASAQAIHPGGSGKMHKFTPVGKQAADSTSVKGSGGSKSPAAPPFKGPSGKMQKFSPVKPQKSGITSVK